MGSLDSSPAGDPGAAPMVRAETFEPRIDAPPDGTEQAAAPVWRRMRGRFLGRGLAAKMVWSTFPIVAGVVLVTQLAIGFANYRTELGALQARAELIVGLTAEAVARPLWTFDAPVYQSQLRAIARDRAFISAALIDPAGKVIFRYDAPRTRGSSITVAAPVLEPNSAPASVLARLELTLGTAELATGIRQQLTIGLVAFAVLLISFAATVHLALRRLVMAPLAILLHAMGRGERKEWQLARWASGDEIGRLVAGFNRMVEGLRSGDEARTLLRELRLAERRLIENHAQLERANKLVLDSINYGRRIQAALLPDLGALADRVRDIAVVWEPRDIVGGDLYWAGTVDGKVILAVMDCTGHGVPGAFMTMIAASALDRVIQHHNAGDPAEMLAMIDRLVRLLLRQDRADRLSDDGLDGAICVFDPAAGSLVYAGAMIPLLYARDGRVEVVKPDRRSLGYHTGRLAAPFRNHAFAVTPGTTIYLATDGVTDQPGPSGRLFGRRRLAEVLQRHQTKPLGEQLDALRGVLVAYRGAEPCPDDVTVLACRLA